MKLGDKIEWKTRKGWNASGKIIDILPTKVWIEADQSAFHPLKRQESKPRYYVQYNKIQTLNGEPYGNTT